jgi:predicted S18 family serine protease
MSELKKLNQLSNDVLQCESEIESLQYKLTILQGDVDVDARLSLEINHNKRGSSTHYLSKEEVVSILNSRLVAKHKERITALENYNSFVQSNVNK